MATTIRTKIQDNDEFKRISVITNTDGKLHRKVLSPHDDISNEDDAVKQLANSLWTDEVKAAWQVKINNHEIKYGAQ